MKFWKYAKRRGVLLLIVLVVATCAAVSIIYAKYVTDETVKPDVSVIAEGKLQITVAESAPNYTITNTSSSNIPAYVRFAVVVNWQSSEGYLWVVPPTEGVDYTITADNCTKLGDYYYYNGTRAPGEAFPVVVTPKTEMAGYELDVKIPAEGIQCLPQSAAENAWGAKFNGSAWVTVTP